MQKEWDHAQQREDVAQKALLEAGKPRPQHLEIASGKRQSRLPEMENKESVRSIGSFDSMARHAMHQ